MHRYFNTVQLAISPQTIRAFLELSQGLVSAGIMREVSSGVWRRALKVSPPGSHLKRRRPDA